MSARFSGQKLKLEKARDSATFRSRAVKLLAKITDDSEARDSALRACCQVACRLGLWSECLEYSKQFGRADRVVLAYTALALIRSKADDRQIHEADEAVKTLISLDSVDSVDDLLSTLPAISKPSIRKKRKRVTREYPTGSLPDPERWLPKSERSKQTRKARKGPIVGSQGAAVVGNFVPAGPSTAQVVISKNKKTRK